MIKEPTPQQWARIHALLALQRQLPRDIAHLQFQYDEYFRKLKVQELSFNELIPTRYDPNRCIGLAELAQRQSPVHQVRLIRGYQELLMDIVGIRDADSSIIPGSEPYRPDYARMNPFLRPYFLGPYLGLKHNDRYAELDLLQSDAILGKELLYLQPGGPVNRDTWAAHLPAINAFLDPSGTRPYRIARCTATYVLLVRQKPLANRFDFDRAQHLKAGHLFAGIDTETHDPVFIPFAELSAGTYIPGGAGTGKTSALHVLLRSIFANLDLFTNVYLVDGKDGVAMNRYRHLHPKVSVLFDDHEVWDLMSHLTQLMKVRNAEQRERGTDKATSDFVAVIIDELPAFITPPVDDPKKRHKLFLQELQSVAMRGRSAGLRLFLVSQSPVNEQIPTTIRTNCATTICFRLQEDAHANAIMGKLSATNDPRKLKTGQAIVQRQDMGGLVTVQFPFAELYNPPPPSRPA